MYWQVYYQEFIWLLQDKIVLWTELTVHVHQSFYTRFLGETVLGLGNWKERLKNGMEPFSAEVLKVLKVYLSFCLFSKSENIYSCDHIRAQELLKLLFSCSTKSCHVDKKWTENVLQCYGGFIKVICIKGFFIIILCLKLCTIKID